MRIYVEFDYLDDWNIDEVIFLIKIDYSKDIICVEIFGIFPLLENYVLVHMDILG